jgi:hypothetical protein
LPDGDGAFGVLPAPTPRLANDTDMPDAGSPVDAGCDAPFDSAPPLFVNEAIASNASGLVDPADGQHEPWVELFNAGAEPLTLDDVVLSDSATLANTWAFPAGTVLGGGQFLVVFLDQEPQQGLLHASLLLTPVDDAVSVGDTCGTVFHTLALEGSGVDVSVGLMPDGNTTTAPQPLTPTPGAANVAP